MFQQSGKYEDIVASQEYEINAKQCQVRCEYTNEKDNDIECLSSENIIADGEKSRYNLRNRGERIRDGQ